MHFPFDRTLNKCQSWIFNLTYKYENRFVGFNVTFGLLHPRGYVSETVAIANVVGQYDTNGIAIIRFRDRTKPLLKKI